MNNKQTWEQELQDIIAKVADDVRKKGYGPCSVAHHYASVWMEKNKPHIEKLESQLKEREEQIEVLKRELSSLKESIPGLLKEGGNK